MTGTERGLAPGTDIRLEVVRTAVNEQYPSLRPSLYPAVMTTEPRPFGILDAMWLAFQALFHCLFRRRACGHPPRRSPDPPLMGVVRAGCLPSRLHGRPDRAIIWL